MDVEVEKMGEGKYSTGIKTSGSENNVQHFKTKQINKKQTDRNSGRRVPWKYGFGTVSGVHGRGCGTGGVPHEWGSPFN